MQLAAPVLSEFDPVVESEGSIDPLSLARVYDRLADRILPAITVRMSRIRFLTATAVGARTCAEWDEDALAADEETPPWLVFEWFAVESFVRSREELKDTGRARRIAGFNKVEAAYRVGRRVSRAAYLKTPTVFGFTGIFRRMAEKTQLVDQDQRLDDTGYELVRAWEKDQDLEGFLDGSTGAGARFRAQLQRAVRQGMDKGQTVDQPSDFWRDLALRLDPGRIGGRERRVLYEIVRGRSDPRLGHAAELVEAVERGGGLISGHDEAEFLRKLGRSASSELAEALDAIDAYEGLCRPLSDAFDLLRHLSTEGGGAPVGAGDFEGHRRAKKFLAAVEKAVARFETAEKLLGWEPEVRALVDRYQDVHAPAQLFRSLIDHHEAAQAEKPPDGKRPWLERGSGDRVLVRTAYQVPELSEDLPPYLHEYRTPTLSGFLQDLGRIR